MLQIERLRRDTHFSEFIGEDRMAASQLTEFSFAFRSGAFHNTVTYNRVNTRPQNSGVCVLL